MIRPEAAVADAGPLIHLDELSCLHLLEAYEKVWVPGTVAIETERHRQGWRKRAPGNIERIDVDAGAIDEIREKISARLDLGELESLAFWQGHRDASLLCDDLKARTIARELGASVIGTLGLLIKGAKTGRIELDEALQLILSIPRRSTLHIRRDLIQVAVAEVRKALG
jgi:predicted nucleic acid-binding protein